MSEQFTVPVDAAHFAGHFPGRPVYPAVSQLHVVVMPLVARAYPQLAPLRRAVRLRFHRAIVPGDVLEVQLDRTEQRVKFTITVDGALASSGALEFGLAPHAHSNEVLA